MNLEFREFKKTEDSINTTDAFRSVGVHIYHDANDQVDGVEVFRHSQVFLSGVQLVRRVLSEVVSELSTIGLIPKLEDWGYSFLDDTLRIGSEDFGIDPDPVVSSIYVALKTPKDF
ncbi:hypothetical protein [Undibacterium flavidum]|uniref:Uncharacterized protein n=1 Tax=Undibacterium flavidum TaxID=2762297 RepID=A0ABR6YAP9_9BURK|nr:hypothetical protein [Undibacterium flavidum]MBC3873636.1 hypothetical protein [Undibacterium flavidum]